MSIIMILYYIISGFIGLLLLWNFLKTDDPGDAFYYLVILFPLVLRLARVN